MTRVKATLGKSVLYGTKQEFGKSGIFLYVDGMGGDHGVFVNTEFWTIETLVPEEPPVGTVIKVSGLPGDNGHWIKVRKAVNEEDSTWHFVGPESLRSGSSWSWFFSENASVAIVFNPEKA